MVRDELCVFMERNHSIGVHGAPPPRSSPPGLCNVNNLAGKLFPEKSAHIPPTFSSQQVVQIKLKGYRGQNPACDKLPRANKLHRKTLIEIAMVHSTNSGSFPSNSHVSATFSFLLKFGEIWSPTNCEEFNADGLLMGRKNLDKSVW